MDYDPRPEGGHSHSAVACLPPGHYDLALPTVASLSPPHGRRTLNKSEGYPLVSKRGQRSFARELCFESGATFFSKKDSLSPHSLTVVTVH
jgi:hypothetical protein